MKMNRTKITIILITYLLLTMNFNPTIAQDYDWNRTETYGLNEEDNIEYGTFAGKHNIHSQYLTSDYESSIKYIREGIGVKTDTMENSSFNFRNSASSGYYSSYDIFRGDSLDWINLPTYIKAINETGNAPGLNYTLGVTNMGFLCLNAKTILEFQANMIYIFSANLTLGEFYDLNLRTTETVNIAIYYNDILSDIYTTDGINREINPLFARGNGTHLVYMYSSSSNYIIMEPRTLEVSETEFGTSISDVFENEPDQIWNETRQDWQRNNVKETIHAFSFTVEKGDYEISYIRFDDTVNTQAYICTNSKLYSEFSQLSYYDKALGMFFSTDVAKFHFEEKTELLVFIKAEAAVEFDYILKTETIDIPVLEENKKIHYLDQYLTFSINISEKSLVLVNGTESYALNVMKYTDDNTWFVFTYQMENYIRDSEKVILEPGMYVFSRNNEEDYDLEIQYSIGAITDFDNSVNDILDFSLTQENGTMDSYKVFEITIDDAFTFINLNLSLVTQDNYTTDIETELFAGSYPYSISSSDFTLGNQEDNNTFLAYPDYNNTQIVNFYTSKANTTEYLLVYIDNIYNNSFQLYPDTGPTMSESIQLDFQLILEERYPDGFINKGIDVHEIEYSLLNDGNDIIDEDFFYLPENEDVFFIKLDNAQEFTWYTITISTINGTIDYYDQLDFLNPDYNRPDQFEGIAVWNDYYYKDVDQTTLTEFYEVNDTFAPDNATYTLEFGTVSDNLLFMFMLYTNNRNGSLSIHITPHTTRQITPLNYGEFNDSCIIEEPEEPDKGISKTTKIVLYSVGGAVGLGVIGVIVWQVMKRR